MTKDFILDPKSQTALSSIMELTGKDEETCMLLALTFFAEALIYVTANQGVKSNQKPGKTNNWMAGLMSRLSGKEVGRQGMKKGRH
jgi:hypothetical protein